MKSRKQACFLASLVCAGALPVAGHEAPSIAGIDAVFAAWSGIDRPGCALAVQKDGVVIYAKGYGMANLEAVVPNTPDTIFDIGSVSKQFTAMAVVLLAEDRKLSLDDDIREYLPEIPDYGTRITINQLLHHTSGLRNYTDLFDLAGVPEVDLTTTRDALDLIARQRGVNFKPGDEFMYSDTNYFLAGEIVRRVSGISLRQFSEERIFRPLGMTRTHINDQPREIVPGRAIGYEPTHRGYLSYLSNFEQVGDGSVLTTVLDLSRWQRNFEQPRVGGKRAIELLLQTAMLNDGSRTAYGSGVFVDTYRGLPWIHHGGEWVGYRAAVSRFPSEKLSVVVACNVIGSLNATALTLGVADHYLGAAAKGPPPPRADGSAADQAGLYWSSDDGTVRRFEARHGILTLARGSSSIVLVAEGQGRYRKSDAEPRSTYQFFAGNASPAMRMEEHCCGRTAHYVRVSDDAHDAPPIGDYTGRYLTDDLPGYWQLIDDKGTLVRRQPYQHDTPLVPAFADTFVGSLSEGDFLVHFVRGAGGRVTGMLISGEMLRPMMLARQQEIAH